MANNKKKQPLHFPRESERIFREAQQFRRLTPTERAVRILDLIASGCRILAASSKRQESEKLRQLDEQRWREIHKELFARHGI